VTRVFFDTNVLVYAEDTGAGAKRDRSRQLILAAVAANTAVLSTQVLMEFYNVAVRRLKMRPELALERTRDYSQLHVVAPDTPLVLAALELCQRGSLSHWDALVVSAAAAGGCQVLYTEDLQDGRVFEGVRVVNPFASAGL
jgi:predicted nucleic acid-binding protein